MGERLEWLRQWWRHHWWRYHWRRHWRRRQGLLDLCCEIRVLWHEFGTQSSDRLPFAQRSRQRRQSCRSLGARSRLLQHGSGRLRQWRRERERGDCEGWADTGAWVSLRCGLGWKDHPSSAHCPHSGGRVEGKRRYSHLLGGLRVNGLALVPAWAEGFGCGLVVAACGLSYVE